MSNLADKTCVPCKGGVPPLTGEALQTLAEQLPQWRVVDEHHLERTFKLKNFREALAFINRIGELAEEQWHHPDVYLRLGPGGYQALDPQDRWPNRERLRHGSQALTAQ